MLEVFLHLGAAGHGWLYLRRDLFFFICWIMLHLLIFSQGRPSKLAEPPGSQYAGVAFSSAVRGGVRYTALLAIQKCGCLHSTMGCGHFSL